MKEKIQVIKDWIGKLLIPKHSIYCHYEFKKRRKYGISARPCVFWKMKYNKKQKCKMEYCRYLKDYLDIQDQVKDCGINE